MHSDTTRSWTPVALSADLPVGTVMPVHTAAGSIALWRSASGHTAATDDRCPHRGMRLSHGFVRGEALSCIYHGWSYAQAGNCLRIPAHPGLVPPETIRAATHPVEESDGIIWVATGKPEAGPPRFEGLIPLRSLTVAASFATIEAAAAAEVSPEGLVEITLGAALIVLLLSAQDEGKTLIHVLLKAVSDPAAGIAASRTVESLRRKAENLQKERIAP
ncbi:Rieske 2Fe-2S domain-containing protein [Pararhizobium sp. DWP1-1-3]|uniref:Rieske 2Fe-2S domain-containing protein n=1 Tax=Pararhizobium sp. DWP1-1-3 TaxID=2804652 RepID=UPI003CE90CC9